MSNGEKCRRTVTFTNGCRMTSAIAMMACVFVGCAAPRSASIHNGSPGEASAVKVAGIVLKWVKGDKEANWRRAEPLIREAAA
ncbi:MAG: hypothetical protein GX616_24860, partial [Planctomycetes bacterium]|nr:hypothetical protein [Planctomycetota bacterium]